MCGRFAYFGDGHHGYEMLHLPPPPAFENYNIAPSQNILAIRTSPTTGALEYFMLHWGLVPFWSKSEKTKFPLINARAEGIENKPSFRSPFKHRRCIIPASGFYEWRQINGTKQPYFIHPIHQPYFAFAGIWDHWRSDNDESVDSCAIITTEANELIRPIHDRMPVILEKYELLTWLDEHTAQADLMAMLKPCSDGTMEAYQVSTKVNNPRNNGPECVAKSLA